MSINIELVMSMKIGLKTLFHCVFSLQYHLVIVTKYRRKCINAPMQKRLEEIFNTLLKKWDGSLLEFNSEKDHCHLLISINPKTQPSKLVNNLKTVSSRYIRKEFKEHLSAYSSKDYFWSRSYCIITCGGAPLSVLKQYIQNQKKLD